MATATSALLCVVALASLAGACGETGANAARGADGSAAGGSATGTGGREGGAAGKAGSGSGGAGVGGSATAPAAASGGSGPDARLASDGNSAGAAGSSGAGGASRSSGGAGGLSSGAGGSGVGGGGVVAAGGVTGTGGALPKDPFTVVSAGTVVDIYVDANDSPSVVRAVGDLKSDVFRVSGATPAVKNTTTGLSATGIMVGTLGKSPAIDALVTAGKLDATGVSGKWESFVIQAVSSPVAGVTRALVIAGSDRRGTIYGVYELSQRMGVSPWYWWADVAPTVSSTVTVDGAPSKQGEPSVQYRGIFINDEENFAAWAAAKMDSGKMVGPETYKRVFELLLRLKANYLWPAMHAISDEFNKYAENAQNADLYGIVMSSAHPEILLRNNEKEWGPWAAAHKTGGSTPAYDYSVNPNTIYDYWDFRVQANGKYENGYQLGMRGVADSGLVAANAPTTADKVTLMEKLFTDQRKILSTRVSTNMSSIFQIFTPYKEVLTLYNAGLKVPDDVMILWTEDNHGYIRQLPDETERARSGGGGVYYHFSYWGAPTSYLWLCSTPLSLTYEEMRKAYDFNAKRLWLVNVGDIKPAEIATEFFMRLGWNVNDWNESNVADFVTGMAARDFGPAVAAEISDIVMQLLQISIARRPEFMGKDVYNLVNYGDEGQQRVDALGALLGRANTVNDGLPAGKKDAFYELVLYPLRATYYQMQKYVAAAKADLYAKQGRTAAVTKYRDLATTAYDTVRSDLTYYTGTVAGGKWSKIMNPYNSAQPTIEAVPTMATAPAAASPALGVVYEGQSTGSENLGLSFSSYGKDTRFIDIFTKGTSGFDWTATGSQPWIKLSKSSGTVADEQRIWASIDWAAVPTGTSTATISVTSGANSKTINVNVSNPTTPSPTELTGYVEANGYVAIEAEHFTQKTDRGGAQWKVFKQLGRSGDCVKVLPDVSASIAANFATTSPELDYSIYFFTTGTFPVTVYRVPTLNTGGSCRVAIGLDAATPQTLKGTAADGGGAWSTNVTEQIEKLSTTIQVTNAGYHTLKLFKVDPSMVVDRIVIDTGGLRPSYLGPPESYRH